jgi:hypothetical protein
VQVEVALQAQMHAAGGSRRDQQAIDVTQSKPGICRGQPDRLGGELGSGTTVDPANLGHAEPGNHRITRPGRH